MPSPAALVRDAVPDERPPSADQRNYLTARILHRTDVEGFANGRNELEGEELKQTVVRKEPFCLLV